MSKNSYDIPGMAETDEPMTPTGRLFVQDRMNQVINCVVATDGTVPSVESVKAEILNSVMFKHPRFRSLMVRDTRGRERWRKTQLDIDRHLIVRHHGLSDEPYVSDQDAINDYISDLSFSSPLSVDKPLWEIHFLVAYKAVVFRFHHALGDGISLMSMLLSVCRRVENPEEMPSIPRAGGGALRMRWSVGALVRLVWFTLVYVLELVLRILWVRDRKNVLSGGAGVELWPRRMATARFRLEDLKAVRRAVSGATINDVIFGVLSSGFSRYLEVQSSKGLKNGLRITGVAMVNMREQPGLQDFTKLMTGESGTRWGNEFGMTLLPVYYRKHDLDPLQFVRMAKNMIDKKKISLDAVFSYKLLHWITHLFGPKLASILNYRIVCNTTFTFSNIVGPQEMISLAGHPLKYIRTTSSSLPHAITMHMLSYAGFADMQILVAKEIIRDPKFLAKLFENALLEMKEAAEFAMKS